MHGKVQSCNKKFVLFYLDRDRRLEAAFSLCDDLYIPVVFYLGSVDPQVVRE